MHEIACSHHPASARAAPDCLLRPLDVHPPAPPGAVNGAAADVDTGDRFLDPLRHPKAKQAAHIKSRRIGEAYAPPPRVLSTKLGPHSSATRPECSRYPRQDLVRDRDALRLPRWRAGPRQEPRAPAARLWHVYQALRATPNSSTFICATRRVRERGALAMWPRRLLLSTPAKRPASTMFPTLTFFPSRRWPPSSRASAPSTGRPRRECRG